MARRLGDGVSVVKAQIHAGGRGKGGGVKVVKSAQGSARGGHQDPGHDARDPSDRTVGSEGGPCAGRAGAQDQAGVVSRSRHRPIQRKAGDDGEPRRWRGDREGCRRNTGSHLQRVHQSRRRPARVPDAQARVRARSRRAPGCAGGEADERGVAGLCRNRRLSRRDQSADRHRGRQPARPRRRR